jgi:hypothetical protein
MEGLVDAFYPVALCFSILFTTIDLGILAAASFFFHNEYNELQTSDSTLPLYYYMIALIIFCSVLLISFVVMVREIIKQLNEEKAKVFTAIFFNMILMLPITCLGASVYSYDHAAFNQYAHYSFTLFQFSYVYYVILEIIFTIVMMFGIVIYCCNNYYEKKNTPTQRYIDGYHVSMSHI